MSWFAVRVGPSMEKRVARAFTEHGVETFMPMETMMRPVPVCRCDGECRCPKRTRRPKDTKFDRPLFRGYVIVAGDPVELLALTHDVHGAVHMVMESGQPAVMPDFWIADIGAAWKAGEYDRTLPRCRKTGKVKRKLEVGDTIRVCGGLYYGAPGKLLKLLGRRRAEIEAEWFRGQIVKTKIDLDHLEAA